LKGLKRLTVAALWSSAQSLAWPEILKLLKELNRGTRCK